MTTASAPLLKVQVSAGYQLHQPVLRDVDLRIERGRSLGLVGESGSGKSTLARAIMRLTRFTGGWDEGSVLFEGRELYSLSERELRRIRGSRMSLVLQSPMTALNPVLTIERHFREAWRAHADSSDEGSFRDRLDRTLEDVQLPVERDFFKRYPGQISVGQAQRVLVALGILHRPALLIADEPTSRSTRTRRSRGKSNRRRAGPVVGGYQKAVGEALQLPVRRCLQV